MAKKDTPTAKNPDITTTGDDVSSISTATVRDGKSITTVKASYSAEMDDESPTKLKATTKINCFLSVKVQSPIAVACFILAPIFTHFNKQKQVYP